MVYRTVLIPHIKIETAKDGFFSILSDIFRPFDFGSRDSYCLRDKLSVLIRNINDFFGLSRKKGLFSLGSYQGVAFLGEVLERIILVF
ncbi:MAG: hypothetical protein U9P14_04375 [Gemmatimonadota bacterium]|nr:hypothetical protein [Gemmatimonadota bacterium]